MSDKDLKRRPHGSSSNPAFWWYEEKAGIVVVADHVRSNMFSPEVTIPWRSIRAALKRKDKR